MNIKVTNRKILCLCIFLIFKSYMALAVVKPIMIPGVYHSFGASRSNFKEIEVGVVSSGSSSNILDERYLLLLTQFVPAEVGVVEENTSYSIDQTAYAVANSMKGELATVVALISHTVDEEKKTYLSLFFPEKVKNIRHVVNLKNELTTRKPPVEIVPYYERVDIEVTEEVADGLLSRELEAPPVFNPGAMTVLLDLRKLSPEEAVGLAINKGFPRLPDPRVYFLNNAKPSPLLVIQARLEPPQNHGRYLPAINQFELDTYVIEKNIVWAVTEEFYDLSSTQISPSSSEAWSLVSPENPNRISMELPLSASPSRHDNDSGAASLSTSVSSPSVPPWDGGNLSVRTFERLNISSPDYVGGEQDENTTKGGSPLIAATGEVTWVYTQVAKQRSKTSDPVSGVHSEPVGDIKNRDGKTNYWSVDSFGVTRMIFPNKYLQGDKNVDEQKEQPVTSSLVNAISRTRSLPTHNAASQFVNGKPDQYRTSSDSAMTRSPSLKKTTIPIESEEVADKNSSKAILSGAQGGPILRFPESGWYGDPPPLIVDLIKANSSDESTSVLSPKDSGRIAVSNPLSQLNRNYKNKILDSFWGRVSLFYPKEYETIGGTYFPYYFASLMREFFESKIRSGNLNLVDKRINQWLSSTIRFLDEALAEKIDWHHPLMTAFANDYMVFLSRFQTLPNYKDVVFKIFDMLFDHAMNVMECIAILEHENIEGEVIIGEDLKQLLEVVSKEGMRLIAAARRGDPIVLSYKLMPSLKSEGDELTREDVEDRHRFQRFEGRVKVFYDANLSEQVSYPACIEIFTETENDFRRNNEPIVDSLKKMLGYIIDGMSFSIVSDCMQSMGFYGELIKETSHIEDVVAAREIAFKKKPDVFKRIQYILFTKLITLPCPKEDKPLLKVILDRYINDLQYDRITFDLGGKMTPEIMGWLSGNDVENQGRITKIILGVAKLAWSYILNEQRLHDEFKRLKDEDKLKIVMVKRVGSMGRSYLNSLQTIYGESPPSEIINQSDFSWMKENVGVYGADELTGHDSDPTKYKPIGKRKSRKDDGMVVDDLTKMTEMNRQLTSVRAIEYFTTEVTNSLSEKK